MNDYVTTGQRRQFVIDQLNQYAGQKKQAGDSTYVLCPYHSEKTPSGRIFHGETTKLPGWFRCYGCGESRSWNDVAPKLGLKGFERSKPQDEYANLAFVPDEDQLVVKEGYKEEDIEFSDLPPNKKWRGISTNLLIDLGARKCRVNHPEHGLLKPKVWLPVYVQGKLRGYIKARLNKHPDYPSYVNAGNGATPWSKTYGLFPFDYTIKVMRKLGSHTVVLVEGPRDALRLLAAGIPAMCILGTQSWTEYKNKLLELAGVTRVVLMFDGDDAGIAATEKIKPSVSNMFDARVVKLWSITGSPFIQFKDEDEPSKAAKAAGVSLWDPGCCPDWILKRLKTKYFS